MFAGLTPLLWAHFLGATAAIVVGGLIYFRRKGDRTHRLLGKLYVAAMLLTLVTVTLVPASVLRIGDTGVGFFHVLIIVAGLALLGAVLALRRWKRTRQPHWLRLHQIRFTFSYAGLWMAGLSQVATNPRFGLVEALTPLQFWTAFALANIAIFLAAMVFVRLYLARGDPRRSIATRV